MPNCEFNAVPTVILNLFIIRSFVLRTLHHCINVYQQKSGVIGYIHAIDDQK